MIPKKALLKKPGLYLVTDSHAFNGRNLLNILSGSLKAGLDMVQFRDKAASDINFFKTGLRIKKLLKGKALFIINDRVHMALALDADGVHLGPMDIPVKIARKILGKRKIIGLSVSSLKEALNAQKQPVDYIAIGSIFKTSVKPDYKLVGLKTLKQVVKKIRIPLVAIGGVNQSNIEEVRKLGVKRIAVVRAILKTRNPYSATKKLLKKI